MNRPASFLLLLALCFSQAATAQTDSIQVVKADWQRKRIGAGLHWKHHHFTNNTLFKSNQHISILEIKPRRKIILDLGYAPRELKPTSAFGQEAGALAALNGTFFDIKNGGSVNHIQADGQRVSPNRTGKSGQRAAHQKAALVFKEGRLHIAKWDGTDNWEGTLAGEDVMVSGPLLRLQNQDQSLDGGAFNRTRHPRTLVVVTRNNRVLLITVDGRHANAAGMSMAELTKLARWLKAKDAINLDGGGSTTLWIKGLPNNGVVNYPADNKQWTHAGERKVANVILVRRRRR